MLCFLLSERDERVVEGGGKTGAGLCVCVCGGVGGCCACGRGGGACGVGIRGVEIEIEIEMGVEGREGEVELGEAVGIERILDVRERKQEIEDESW